MWYVKEDWEVSDSLAWLISLAARPWLAMLALGGLGHQLDKPQLFLSYWNVMLIYIVAKLLFGNGKPLKLKAAQSREELKK